jgi:hypothetical protein
VLSYENKDRTGYLKNCFSRAQWLIPAIPGTREVEIRRIVVLGQPGQKVRETSSKQNKPGTHLESSYMGGIGRRIEVSGPPREMGNPI